MSGIAGLFNLDGCPADRGDLYRMVDIIAHRGPDGSALWCQGVVGLGHRMLHTTPESLHERLPRVAREGDLVLTADARIDNRDELIALLRLKGRHPGTITDGELILAAYEKWGEQSPERLIGDFAFALWDGRAQHLFCARDHLGVKPFYYHHRPGRHFAFGSEIKAILCLDRVPCAIDDLRIAYYLARQADDPEITFYRDIRSLPPAHTMTIRRDGTLHRRRYWSLDPDRTLHLDSDAAYAEGFLEVFTEAVRCRLRSSTSPSVMLSGGLDSSSVACVARKVLEEEGRGPLDTFSAIFPDLPEEALHKADERHYVEAIRQQGQITAHEISLNDTSPLVDLDRTLWHLDAPYLASNVYLLSSMYRAAREAGIRTMLDGAEGDIVVSHGVAYLGELAILGQWDRFAEEVIALTTRAGISPQGWFRHTGRHYLAHHAQQGQWKAFIHGAHVVSAQLRIPYRFLLWQCGVKPGIPQAVRSALRGKWSQDKDQPGLPPLMAPQLARRTDFSMRMQERERRYAPSQYTAREAHWLNLDAGGGSIAAILAETNHIAAAFGIEERHPFYDSRLVEYCLALPPEQKLHNGWTRMVLRRAMDGLLPPEVQWRTDKADLSPNFYRNLIQMEQQQLDQLITKDLDRLSCYIDVDVLSRAHQEGNKDMLWLAYMLSQWLRQAGVVQKHRLLTRKPEGTTFNERAPPFDRSPS